MENNCCFAVFHRCQNQVQAPQMGGDDMNEAVISVFAALLWHTQILREELDKIDEGQFFLDHCMEV